MTTTDADVRNAASVGSEEKLIRATVGLSVVGEEARPIDPEVARRVLRKIDLFLMPAMLLGVMITSMLPLPRFYANSIHRIWNGVLG